MIADGVRPTSQQQYEAFRAGLLPEPEQVRDRLWAVPVAMPRGQRGLTYNLCYLVQDDDRRLHVIDPGWDSPENRQLLARAIRAVTGDAAIASVVLTHGHPDHAGMAGHIRGETGAPVVMHEREDRAAAQLALPDPRALEGWGVPPIARPELEALGNRAMPPAPRADLLLHGELDHLRIPGWDVEAIHTPGHTPGSVTLRIAEAGVLLTGDHVLPEVHPGLGLGGATATNPIADYLASLEAIATGDALEVLPGHGYRFEGLVERCTGLAEHHRRRTREVAAARAAHPGATVWEVASTLTWTAGWTNLHGFHLFSALSQTALHLDHLSRSAQPSRPQQGRPQERARSGPSSSP